MARSSWNDARTKGERASFDYFREALTIKSGAMVVALMGVLDASQERNDRVKSPDGTFPVLATLSCWRAELGFVPTVSEAIRISRTEHPEEEQVYLVVSSDSNGDLLTIELQASTNSGNPFPQ
jgi:hypothetical protein